MMVSLHHGSLGKVHKFAGTHFCRFSKVCKCIRHTIIIIIATYKFPGYMPSARSCFKALLKDSRNMQTFFDQL